MNTKLSEESLSYFYGTENYYRHALNKNLLYTDGVQYVAEEGKAYWLIDIVASVTSCFVVDSDDFTTWTLTKDKEKAYNKELDTQCDAVVICDDGNGKELYKQYKEYTEFPLDNLEMFLIQGVLMLASEY